MADNKTPEELLNELREVAEANGGKLLSDNWLGTQAPHRFTFPNGREFEMRPNNLKKNGWPTWPDSPKDGNEEQSKPADTGDGQSATPTSPEAREAFSDGIFSAHKQNATPPAPTANADENAQDDKHDVPETEDGHKGPRKPK